jgi:hypothetical protein
MERKWKENASIKNDQSDKARSKARSLKTSFITQFKRQPLKMPILIYCADNFQSLLNCLFFVGVGAGELCEGFEGFLGGLKFLMLLNDEFKKDEALKLSKMMKI